MNDRRTRQLTAGLGGMALALLMLALVVQQAQANTACSVCHDLRGREAMRGPCKQYVGVQPYYYLEGCVTTYIQQKCWQGDNPPCPGTGDDNGIVKDCGSEACRFVPTEVTELESPNGEKPCGDYLTDMGGGTICDNSCYAQSCGASTEGKTCGDTQLPIPPGTPKVRPSPCYVTCGCH